MDRPTFTIIVPSSGRRTLARTLASIAEQIEPGDEVIVDCNRDGDDGLAALDRGVGKATGSHLMCCDDDDIFTAGALARVRSWIEANPGKIGVFRRAFNPGTKQWKTPELGGGNVQRMCMVLPNKPGQLASWTDPANEYEWMMLVETARLQNAEIVFVDDVIGFARPETNPVKRLRYKARLRTRVRGALSARRR